MVFWLALKALQQSLLHLRLCLWGGPSQDPGPTLHVCEACAWVQQLGFGQTTLLWSSLSLASGMFIDPGHLNKLTLVSEQSFGMLGPQPTPETSVALPHHVEVHSIE
ncbi:expressed unknown protein [Seminavis robusta]|uniref:Uncharacterized protein n=1 Tax=Seminavis robusta TaxID=568900 RepID=A0A9N8E708_9STRA|nr:expressed unknown protein [Seminavis robusta]|eukprot:Sro690_g187692.1  (107) ;mRNA; f:45205-45525